MAVIVTGGHTEFVLTRGVGLHTVLGFSIDVAIGNYLDRLGQIVGIESAKMIKDEQKLKQFVDNWSPSSLQIADDTAVTTDEILNLLNGVPSECGGMHLERFARYGDSRRKPFPIPEVHSTNVTFAGLETFFK